MNLEKETEYTKKQHFIPQFSIRPFEIEKNICLVAKINNEIVTVSSEKTEDIMQHLDLYESIKENGEYINRNVSEKDYKYFEDFIFPKYNRFIKLMSGDDYQKQYERISKPKSNEWPHIESALLLHLILLLIRNPKIKNLFFDNDRMPYFIKPILYRLYTQGLISAVKLSKKMLQGEQLEIALQFLKDSGDEEYPFKKLVEHVFKGYSFRIYKTIGSEKIFLSDDPVIIQKYETADYVLPLTPELCIGAIPIRIKNKHRIYVDSIVYPMTDENVKTLNTFSILNTKNTLIIQEEKDLKFIKNILDNQ
jgi:hypothetical protein